MGGEEAAKCPHCGASCFMMQLENAVRREFKRTIDVLNVEKYDLECD
jgi:hypothetical protein